MNRRSNQTLAIVGLGLFLGVAASAALGGPIQFQCELDLNADRFNWDRLRATGSIQGTVPACDGMAPDSLNDGLPFCAFEVQVAGSSATVSVESLEPTNIDFDPLVAVYCGSFSPTNPVLNLLAFDDDGLGYPDASISFVPSSLTDTFVVVITSYSSFEDRQFGMFNVTLEGLALTGVCACSIGSCAGDANADGVVDFGDTTAVLANWLNDYSPGTGPGDANGDGVVNMDDLNEVLMDWLEECP